MNSFRIYNVTIGQGHQSLRIIHSGEVQHGNSELNTYYYNFHFREVQLESIHAVNHQTIPLKN